MCSVPDQNWTLRRRSVRCRNRCSDRRADHHQHGGAFPDEVNDPHVTVVTVRLPHPARSDRKGAVDHQCWLGGACRAGSVTVTVKPPLGFGSAATAPWCARTIDLTMARPSPLDRPPATRLESLRWNGSNNRSTSVSGIASPLLRTVTTARSATRLVVTSIQPPGWLYRMALSTGFRTR